MQNPEEEKSCTSILKVEPKYKTYKEALEAARKFGGNAVLTSWDENGDKFYLPWNNVRRNNEISDKSV